MYNHVLYSDLPLPITFSIFPEPQYYSFYFLICIFFKSRFHIWEKGCLTLCSMSSRTIRFPVDDISLFILTEKLHRADMMFSLFVLLHSLAVAALLSKYVELQCSNKTREYSISRSNVTAQHNHLVVLSIMVRLKLIFLTPRNTTMSVTWLSTF